MALRYNDLAAVIGSITLLYLSWALLSFIVLNIRPSSISTYHHAPKKEPTTRPWALVTGASGGLGLAIAHELASRGFSIVLHGRTTKKLETAAQAIKSRYPSIKTQLLILDAANLPRWSELSDTVLTVLGPLHLTVLVNNLGGAGDVHPEWGALADRTHEELDNFVDTNARFTLHITRAVISLLTRSQPALIVNISSAAAGLPVPYAVTYAATKAFISSFGRALQVELQVGQATKGIEVLTLEVGKTVTVGAGRTDKDLSLDTLSATAVAKACVDRVGCGYALVVPNLVHQVQMAAVNWLPDWIVKQVAVAIGTEEMEKSRRAWKEQ